MSFGREDYEEMLQTETARRLQEREHEIRKLEQAEVASDLLTRDSHWDAFLQILQAESNFCAKQRREVEERICDPQRDSEQVAKLRMEGLRLRTIIETLEHVIQLPKAMKERGEKARGILQGYTRH